MGKTTILILSWSVATILDKNVKKNTPRIFDFRILHFKDRYTQDTSPSPQKKTMLKGHRNISGPDLTTLIRGGGGGATMVLNSLGVSPVHNKV